MLLNVNYIFYFLSVTIPPVCMFLPVATWIPLIVSALLLFIFQKDKFIYIRRQSSLELLSLLILSYICLSLLWSINLNYAVEFLIHLIVLYISFRIVLEHSNRITNYHKVKKLLLYSLNISCFVALIDMYFYIGIKYYFQVFINFFYIPSLNKYFSISNEVWYFLNGGLYKEVIQAGMLSGLYNRGLSVIIILGMILCSAYYKNKVIFILLILNLSLIITLGESFSLVLVFFCSFITFFSLMLLKKKISVLFTLLLVFYFLGSPILLDNSGSKSWNEKHNDIHKKIIELSKIDLKYTFDSLLQGETKNIALYAEKTLATFQSKIFHRTMIWSYTIKKIQENPIKGKGLSSSRKLGATDRILLVDSLNNNKLNSFPAIPLHPHNNTLQIWLELGLIGCLLFLSLYVFLWKSLIKKLSFNNPQDYFLMLAFVSIFLINQVSFGLFQTWWLAAISYFIIFINIFIKNRN